MLCLAATLLTICGFVAVAKGEMPGSANSLANRHRLELRVGYWNSGQLQSSTSESPLRASSSVEDIMGAFSYAYWVSDNVATHVTFSGLVAVASSITAPAIVADSTVVLSSALLGFRYYPVPAHRTPLLPFLSVGAGPYLGVESTRRVSSGIHESTRVLGTFGVQLGGGLDIPMGRHFMAGINVGYNMLADFPEPVAGKANYSGIEVGAGISLLLGKGK
jgi:hypothetical protein